MSPLITTILAFLIVKNNTKDIQDDEAMRLINGILFSLWILLGYCVCSGVFIISPVHDR